MQPGPKGVINSLNCRSRVYRGRWGTGSSTCLVKKECGATSSRVSMQSGDLFPTVAMLRWILLLALVLTAHALVPVAPSGDTSTHSGSGLTTAEVRKAVTRNEEQAHYGDDGFQENPNPTLNSSVVEIGNSTDTSRNESPPTGNVNSTCHPDVETTDNVTSGVGCHGDADQASLESSRRQWIETIKRDILSQLGRKSPTDDVMRAIPPLPEVHRWINFVETESEIDAHAWDLGGAESAHTAKTLTVVAFPSTAPNTRRFHSDVPVIYFRLNGTAFQPSTRLATANLGVFIRRTGPLAHARRRSRPEFTHIHVYRLDGAIQPGQDPGMHLVWSRSICVTWADTGRWYQFDVLGVVEQWLRYPQTNHGLLITALDSTKTQLALLTAGDDYEKRYLPYIEIQVSDSPRSRPGKRSLPVNDCDPHVDPSSTTYSSSNKRHHNCCRHPLVIDFRALGWNWVIAPLRYNAYFCSGICPRFSQRTSISVHSHLLQQAGPAGYHGLCCAPASMASISIIFFDDQGRITFRKVPGMVVTRCSCA